MGQIDIELNYEVENAKSWKAYDGVSDYVSQIDGMDDDGGWQVVRSKGSKHYSKSSTKSESYGKSYNSQDKNHRECRYDQSCRLPKCKFSHRSKCAPVASPIHFDISCEKGNECNNAQCRKSHESPAARTKKRLNGSSPKATGQTLTGQCREAKTNIQKRPSEPGPGPSKVKEAAGPRKRPASEFSSTTTTSSVPSGFNLHNNQIHKRTQVPKAAGVNERDVQANKSAQGHPKVTAAEKNFKWPRIHIYNAVKELEKEMKMKSDVVKALYRTSFPSNCRLQHTKVLEVQATNMQLSIDTTVLDNIKEKTRTVISPKHSDTTDITLYEITGEKEERVEEAALRIERHLKNVHVSNLQSLTVYELQNLLLSSYKFLLKEFRSTPGEDSGQYIVNTSKSSSINIPYYDAEPLNPIIQQSINYLKFYQGVINMRVRFGRLVLTKYPRSLIGCDFPADKLKNLLDDENLKSAFVAENSDRRLLLRLDRARGLFVPKSPTSQEDCTVKPVTECVFIIRHLQTNTRFQCTLTYIYEEPRGCMVRQGRPHWSKIKSDNQESHSLMDLYIINGDSNGLAWQFEVTANDSVVLVPKELQAFADALVLPVRRDVTIQDTELLLSNFASPYYQILSGFNSMAWKYIYKDTPLVVSIQQQVSFKKSLRAPTYEFGGPNWRADVTCNMWPSLLHENSYDKTGYEASWSASLYTFFPPPTGKSQDGLQHFLDCLAKVEYVVRGGLLSEQDLQSQSSLSEDGVSSCG